MAQINAENQYVIILIEPQMGENIGASARAMKNFGLQELRIVNPRDGWPNEKADSMSVGAIDLIQNATIFPNIEAAVRDLNYLYATTSAHRDLNKTVIIPEQLACEPCKGSKIGIMFGRENCGLTNVEIAYANKIMTIPTMTNFPSMNIAHAVALVSYEISKGTNKINQGQNLSQELIAPEESLTQEHLEHFYSYLFQNLEATGFFRAQEKKPYIQQKIRNLINRIPNLSTQELQILYGIIKSCNGKNKY
jgi:tRNA/rRNA methyltransferase